MTASERESESVKGMASGQATVQAKVTEWVRVSARGRATEPVATEGVRASESEWVLELVWVSVSASESVWVAALARASHYRTVNPRHCSIPPAAGEHRLRPHTCTARPGSPARHPNARLLPSSRPLKLSPEARSGDWSRWFDIMLFASMRRSPTDARKRECRRPGVRAGPTATRDYGQFAVPLPLQTRWSWK